MLRDLTKKFVEEINYFLTKDELPPSWTSVSGRLTNEQDALQTLNGFTTEELTTEIVTIVGLGLLPPLDDKISDIRNKDLNTLYKYHNFACDFNSFRLDKFDVNSLNDKAEGEWVDLFYYINGFASSDTKNELEKIIKNYNPLATFTTTTLRNHNYMISNYSREGKQCLGFNGDEVIKNYDNLWSNKIKPIRGFVRYDIEGKRDFLNFVDQAVAAYGPKASILVAIAAAYFKGKCMKEEAEYRFLALTTNKLDAVEISCLAKRCIKFNCEVGKENKYYTDSQMTPMKCENTDEAESPRCMCQTD